MPETIDHREEQQLLTAVKKASELVSAGSSPDEAIEKVARDLGYGPGKIRMMGHGYNTGQQLGQWRTGGTSILDKLASFPLCDPEKVIDSIYNGPTPAEKAASCRVDSSYAVPPSFRQPGREKTASVPIPRNPPKPYEPDPGEAINKAYGSIQRTKQASDEGRRRVSAAKDSVTSKVAHLVTYFKKAGHDRLAFETVESAARSYYGDPGATLMNMVYARAGLKEKRAGAVAPVLKQPLNLRAEPFTLIKSAIDAASEAGVLAKQAEELKAVHEKAKKEELRPFAKAAQAAAETGLSCKTASAIFGTEKSAFGFGTEVAAIALGDIAAHKATHPADGVEEDPYGDVSSLQSELNTIRNQSQQAIGMRKRPKTVLASEKRGFLGAGIGTAIGSSLGRTMGTVGKSKDDLVDDAWMGLEDPEHENELRKIKAHAMINQLMTDPDDPISAHDHDKVLTAYNEISSAAPRVAQNVAMLRPALRKRLEGHQEPFEAKELLDIEHGLSKTKLPTPNTSIMSDGPDKLLG